MRIFSLHRFQFHLSDLLLLTLCVLPAIWLLLPCFQTVFELSPHPRTLTRIWELASIIVIVTVAALIGITCANFRRHAGAIRTTVILTSIIVFVASTFLILR